MRKLAFRGFDLQHADGRWYTLDEARAYGEEMKRKYAAARGRGAMAKIAAITPTAGDAGFVYFLRSGDAIKIGFSRDPQKRSRELRTALAEGITALAFVRGTLFDERALHRALWAHGRQGEWFTASRDVVQAMVQSIAAGRVMLPVDERATLSPKEPQYDDT